MNPKPPPLLNPTTGNPMSHAELCSIFCFELALQELDDSYSHHTIPEPILAAYRTFRPSPLIRAYRLEKVLGTPAHVYYKFEGSNTSGSHKLNSAIAQVYYAKRQGITMLTTETGAGQWGSALAMACAKFQMQLTVYMVKGSYEQKPFRKSVIETYGATIIASPSTTTEAGQKILAKFSNTPGSLGVAISEAVEAALTTPNARYVLGSVLGQVILHQTVIGLEAKTALKRLGEYPDILIGCVGGGSNFGGLVAPFMRDRLRKRRNPYFIAAEPASCPSLTRGSYLYDYCDTAMITPLAKMYTLGCEFQPSNNHAGGLRYHGMSPIISQLYHDRLVDEARAIEQTRVFESAVFFTQVEGIVPAPESAHAIHVAMEEAKKCADTGEGKVILFGLSGTGYFDIGAYMQFLDKSMTDHIPTDAEIDASIAKVPKIPGVQ
jgi:tryptophan synthase beta chain